jgi:peptidyl-prolyl cis-trans isomerase SurA
MKLKKVLLGISLFISAVTFAQDIKKEVLFTIDGKPYYTDEFVRVYNKNLDLVKDDSQKDLDNYLDLYVGYKLKVNKANKLGLNNGKQYQGELKTYRNQLSKNYLTDTKVTKELVDEAYQRSLKEIRAAHILLLVDENAVPADTLKAYNKALEVYKKAVAGEDFSKLAAQYSEDPSAKENKGDLGFFSVFRMVYPFENAAYNTPVGSVAKPFRTRFGYHVIKVNEIRPNRGDVTVAHIMIMKPKGDNAEEIAKAKTTIDEIYRKLKQGEDFANLSKQFSQDNSSAGGGGVLQRFSSGELSSEEFENRSFALNKAGDITEPFQTQFGWHIVKLVEKYPVKPLADVQADFENRIRRDDRSKLITDSMNEKLKKKYTVKRNDKVYANVVKALDDRIYTKVWEMPAVTTAFDATLLTINNDRQVSAKAFLDYVVAQQKGGLSVKPVAKQTQALYDKFSEDQLNAYYNDNLETEYPEFGMVMDEYRDGLLLFDLMEKEIWEKAKTDTVGLSKFYNSHIGDYQWKDRVDANIYSSTDEDMIKKARKYIKKGESAEFIKNKLNTPEKINVMEKSGVFETESNVLPKQLKWEEGVSDIIKEGNYYFVVKVNKVMPKGPKTLEEAKGKVINDYQQYLESTWVQDLKKEFSIQVNQDVFAKVKKQLNQK